MSSRHDDERAMTISKLILAGGAALAVILVFGTQHRPASRSDKPATEAAAQPTDDFDLPLSQLQNDTSGQVKSIDRAMPLDQCLATIRAIAANAGVAPVNIVETSSLRIVRFQMTTGSILISCGEDKMVVTKSPHQG